MNTSQPDRPVFPYQRALLSVLSALPQMSHFLSVGVGTGTALKAAQSISPSTNLVGVEIDEVVLHAAIEYFDAPNREQADYWLGDGCAFLLAKNFHAPFDCIFMDAYMPNQIYQPSLQPQILDALCENLAANGLAIYNVIAQNFHEPTLKDFVQSAKKRFPCVLDMPVGMPFSEQNRLVILSLHRQFGAHLRRQLMERFNMERILWSLRLRQL